MSLADPNIIEKIIGHIKMPTPRVKVAFYLFLGIVALALILFTMDRCGAFRFDREVTQIKANANAIVANIKTLESKEVVDHEAVAIEKDRLRETFIDLKEAQEATNQSTAATNAAIEEMEAAKAANYKGTTPAELDAILKQVERP